MLATEGARRSSNCGAGDTRHKCVAVTRGTLPQPAPEQPCPLGGSTSPPPPPRHVVRGHLHRHNRPPHAPPSPSPSRPRRLEFPPYAARLNGQRGERHPPPPAPLAAVNREGDPGRGGQGAGGPTSRRAAGDATRRARRRARGTGDACAAQPADGCAPHLARPASSPAGHGVPRQPCGRGAAWPCGGDWSRARPRRWMWGGRAQRRLTAKKKTGQPRVGGPRSPARDERGRRTAPSRAKGARGRASREDAPSPRRQLN